MYSQIYDIFFYFTFYLLSEISIRLNIPMKNEQENMKKTIKLYKIPPRRRNATKIYHKQCSLKSEAPVQKVSIREVDEEDLKFELDENCAEICMNLNERFLAPPQTLEHQKQNGSSSRNLHHDNIRKLSTKQKTQKDQTRRSANLQKIIAKIGQQQNSQTFEGTRSLQNVLKKLKIKNIVEKFSEKLKRNNIYSQPVEYQKFNEDRTFSILQMEGLVLNRFVQNMLGLLSVIQILLLTVIYSLSLVFNEMDKTFVTNIQIFSFVFYFVEMIIQFTTVKTNSGKKLITFEQIWIYYASSQFWVDFLNFSIIGFDIFTQFEIIGYLRLFLLMKLPQCIDKLEKLEVYLIKSFYNQQYWSLIKVFIFNFCFAHILAIFLSSMASLNTEQNWMIKKGIQNSVWYEKYIWSYYWGTTIMLTVGFGDLVATTYQQALCLIFIETFSCIVLAYNVSCVGTLISNIRAQDLQKSKNFKIFKKLSDSNQIPQSLNWRINNYIEQNSNLKKKFNSEQEHLFIQNLPTILKTEYRRQSNKKVLEKLVFFKGLWDKTLFNLAQNIEMRISHPQQIVKSIGDDFNLIILKNGELGYMCKKMHSQFNEKVADTVQVKAKNNPYITSLDFITKQRSQYEIKSIGYSILYVLQYKKLINLLKETDMDYELYCFSRDKIKNIPEQFEVYKCEYCNVNHFKFNCPKLHYVPLQQHVINRYIYEQNHHKLKRNRYYERYDEEYHVPLKLFKQMKPYRTKKNSGIARQRTSNITSDHQFSGFLKKDKPLSSSYDNFVELEVEDQSSQLIKESISVHRFQKQKMYDLSAKIARDAVTFEFQKRERIELFNDEVWLISADKVNNYNSYFPTDNPSNLSIKFNLEEMIANRQNDPKKMSKWVKKTLRTALEKFIKDTIAK